MFGEMSGENLLFFWLQCALVYAQVQLERRVPMLKTCMLFNMV